MGKYVYSFKEGSKEMKSLLGGKGANLAEMTKIGLPVPSGFTVTTEACNKYYEDGKELSQEVTQEIFNYLFELEKKMDKKFGDDNNPLLVSVRSGAVISMPGMMDTVLNLGLNDVSVIGLTNATGNEWFAYDSYRRFIQMFGDVVLEIPKYKFDTIFDEEKESQGIKLDTDLTVDSIKKIIEKYKRLVLIDSKKEFPQDPKEQLILAVRAVFSSWNNARAIIYRQINDIPDYYGTAVNVQSMAFGNMGETSGTGVAFTRNPSTGEHKVFGEFLMNAQGEDVVAGIRTPYSIDKLQEIMPNVYDEFMNITELLEAHYKDMQDIEFTIEKGKLYMLQTRNGKRTARASLKIAVDLVENNVIDKETALMRIEPGQLDQLLHPNFDAEALANATKIAKGLPASPGAAVGKVYFTPKDAVEATLKGEKTILVRLETSPEDIEGMVAAEGIVTARGGMTSHAAVVARGMGKCCVAGCEEINVFESKKMFKVGNLTFNEGDYISLDGNTGTIYQGIVPTSSVEMTEDFQKIMQWADEIRRLKVRTNADTPKDALNAVNFGAEGIGLCRTEHMFFHEERIFIVRQMIMAQSKEKRVEALRKLLPFQKDDFVGIYKAMGERPVTIRLLDPPLHEFLPDKEEDIIELADAMGIDVSQLNQVIVNLREVNPMLGHRGCRLAITYPEIYEMQVEAIIRAAIEVKLNENIDIKPEIMIPLIGSEEEIVYVKNVLVNTINAVLSETDLAIDYQIGTMIEVPRATLVADKIAKHAEFFSFGTNDLTQMTFGFSRDDAGKFIQDYTDKKILEKDPFERLDQEGVGRLMEFAIELGKKGRPGIKLGICGEHGGDPTTIEFCHRIGLDYVSCSPFRVPIARLAAAQAAITNK